MVNRRMSIQPSNGNNGWGDALLNLPAWIVPSVELSPALEGVSVSVETGEKRSQSSRRFPYGYLVTTSLQLQNGVWQLRRGGSIGPLPPSGGPSGERFIPPLETACNPPYSRSVTGGEYKAQVLIHRGVLIHDY